MQSNLSRRKLGGTPCIQSRRCRVNTRCTRNPEIAVIETCRSIGATFVAFSPLARGFLAGALPEVTSLSDKDIPTQAEVDTEKFATR